MKHISMKRGAAFLANLCLGGFLALPALAQDSLVHRQILSDRPLEADPSLRVVTTKLTLKPGGRITLHTHEGEEHSTVLVGGKTRLPNGKEVTFAADMPIFFAAGQIHGGVTNIDDHDMVLLQTFVVATDGPLSTPAE